ncbi:MAG: segregation/condensation protein A, partial [Planctomycetota bacterium]|nr:segregation/condensation protein A [Planctomycetota bacterium]
LMEIKSKLLLPREVLDEEDEEYEDPRLELVKQLLEYKKFKERALLLEKKLAAHKKRYTRPIRELEDDALDVAEPLPPGNTDVWDLLTAFHRIQLAIGQRVPHEVMLEERPAEDYIAEVRETLLSAHSGRCSFEELFQGARTQTEAIGYFLAILELAKMSFLKLVQEEPGAEIEVERRSEEELREMEAAQEAAGKADPAEEHLLRGEGEEALEEEASLEDEGSGEESGEEE